MVTAERRESTVQTTPFSISAISGDTLRVRGLTRLEDVVGEVPGMSMKQSMPGQTEYEMRGLPSSGGSFATVGMYVNDVPFESSANSVIGKMGIDPDLFDLQRIEVLRGPQGTLYGAGSMGGTIRLITTPADPSKFDGAVQGGVSQTSHGGTNWSASGMLNLPIADNLLALRLVGTDRYEPGFIDRITVDPFPIGPTGACGWQTCTRGNVLSAPVIATSDNYNWEHLLSGRATVRWTPNDALTVDLQAMGQRISLGGFPQADVSAVGIDRLAYYQAPDVTDHIRDRINLYSLNINYDMNFASLTATTAWWRHHAYWTADYTELGENLINYFFGIPDFYPTPYSYGDNVRQFSQELRLTSRSDGRLRWVAGLFYSDFKSEQDQYVAIGPLAFLSAGGAAANPQGVGYAGQLSYPLKQYSIYAEGSYKLTDVLLLTLGLRGFRYDAHQDVSVYGFFTGSGNLTPNNAYASAAATGATPKINLSYQPSANVTWYAQIAKGFRPGGANQLAPESICGTTGPESYGPDSVWDYEIGEKARMLGGALQINADFFYIRWNNVQQHLVLPCSYGFEANIGTAETYGPELELTAHLNRHVNLTVSGSRTTARITSIEPALAGNTIGATEQLAPGNPVLNIPKYQIFMAIDVTVPISSRYDATARLTSTTTGPFHDVDYYVEELPSYTFLDLRLGVAGRGPWSGYLYLDNLTNRIAALSINTHSWDSAVPAYTRAAVNRPRTAGIDLYYRF